MSDFRWDIKCSSVPLLTVNHRLPGGRLGWTGVAKQLAVAAVAVADDGVRPLL